MLEWSQNARRAGVTPSKNLSLTANRLMDRRAVNISGADNRPDTFALLELSIQIRVERAFSLDCLFTGSLGSC